MRKFTTGTNSGSGSGSGGSGGTRRGSLSQFNHLANTLRKSGSLANVELGKYDQLVIIFAGPSALGLPKVWR